MTHTREPRFRQLVPSDLEALAALEAASFNTPWSAEQYAAMIEGGACAVFGAFCGDVLAGYIAVGMHPAAGEMEVYNIAVDEMHRRGGIGRKLLSLAFDAAALNGVARVFLEVRETNAPALALYNSLGFSRVGVRPRYYPDTGEDALVLARDTE